MENWIFNYNSDNFDFGGGGTQEFVEVANFGALPVTGDSGVIYVTLDTNKLYRWSGTTYVEISPMEIPTLANVLDVGNASGPNDISFDAGQGLYFANSSRLREGTIDAGLGGTKGIAQICAVGYELKWEAGRLYVMDGNGTAIRQSLYNFTNAPTVNDDVTKGYLVGSIWTLDDNSVYKCTDTTTGAAVWELQTVGGGLSGTQYVYVAADGTDVENAAELQAAYVTAQGMSPSITNRITIIAAPGNYNFSTANFVMSTQYIDLVSLDGNKSIVFNGSNTIEITANDVFVKGVDVGTLNFTIANSLNLLRVENCTGGDSSFGDGGIASGTFTNCTGGDSSFGGGGGTASGTFNNCTGGKFSFGGGGGTASGTFNNCTGGNISFGGGGVADGVFNSCTGGENSFGGDGGTASGVFTNCTGGDSSFGGSGTSSGIFTSCVGGEYSFGGNGTLSGFLYYCRLTSGAFETPTGGGKITLGIDGSNAIITT
jgi:hypothetical protein